MCDNGSRYSSVSKQRTDKLGGGRGALHDYRSGGAMETFVFGFPSQGRKLVRSLSQVKRQTVESQYVSKKIILSSVAKSMTGNIELHRILSR